MSERFFSTRPIEGDRVDLDGSEAHHLLHVMRASVGHSLTLFDGSGAEFEAVVDKLGRAEVNLRIVARYNIDRELPFELVVGVALPKGDRQKWIVEKLTELGVSKLVPLVTERSVAQPMHSALERLRRSVVEASKQCGRNRLMEIAQPQKWTEWINGDFGLRIADCELGENQTAKRNSKSENEIRRLLAHPASVPLSTVDTSKTTPTQLAIGPEGGFTDEEVESAIAAGWGKVSLGPRILRIETAAVALASVIAMR
jgi:16S rRNA (uracil1498-N3)-methyltransferase